MARHFVSMTPVALLFIFCFCPALLSQFAHGAKAILLKPRENVVRSLDTVPAESLPQPWLDRDAICRPLSPTRGINSDGSVCDPSGLLSERNIKKLNGKLATIFHGKSPFSLVRCPATASTSDATGFRVVFVIVRRMPANGQSLSDRTSSYVSTLFSNWGLSGNCGASVLLFVSMEDRRLFIKTGSLAAQYLTESRIDAVFQAMASELSGGDLKRALFVAFDRIGTYLQEYKGAHVDSPQKGGGESESRPFGPLFWHNGPDWWDLELSFVVLIAAVCMCCACCNGFGGPDAARSRRERRQLFKKLSVVRTEYIRAAMPQYEPDTCPVCQDDLRAPLKQSSPSTDGGNDDGDDDEEGDPLSATQSNSDKKRNQDNGTNDGGNGSERPTRSFRCGHVLHVSCLQSLPNSAADSSSCPVCGYSSNSNEGPRSLNDTRSEDLDFRLSNLRREYPHILTPDVYSMLVSRNPTTWPDTLDDAFLKPAPSHSSHDNGGGNFLGTVGGLLAAGGLGAIIGSMFGGGGGGGGNNNRGYENIGDDGGGGWQTQQSADDQGGGHGAQFGPASWFGQQSDTGEGGHGAQFGPSQWFNQSGGSGGVGQGGGWGSSGGNAGGWSGGGWSGGSARGDNGGGDGGGHGAGW